MQRRRREKKQPKNIFGSTPQSTSATKSEKSRRPSPPKPRLQRTTPPSVPGAKPKPIIEPKPEPVITPVEIIDEPSPEPESSASEEPLEEESQNEEIIEEQILGEKSKSVPDTKPISVIDETPDKEPEIVGSGKSLKARQIIEDSMIKASLASEVEKSKKAETAIPVAVPEPKKTQKKFRSKTSSYQPANRARRLDRSRHMEYKYEMRGLLVEIDVAEEHRSNLLATIWARGERQTTKEAKDFLQEKLTEGVIDEDQMSSLEKVVDGYTIRR